MDRYELLMGGSGKWCLSVDGIWCASGHCPRTAPLEVIGRQLHRFIAQPTIINHKILDGGQVLTVDKVGIDEKDILLICEAYNRKKDYVEFESHTSACSDLVLMDDKEKKTCVCGVQLEPGEWVGHHNVNGGFCCTHYGNTCGHHGPLL